MTQAIINADSSAVQTVSFPISPSVSLVGNRPCTTSLAVAEHFGKKHHHVMRDIRKIADELPEDLRASNFGFTSRTVLGPRLCLHKISVMT